MPRTPIAHTLGELEKLVQSVTSETTAGIPEIGPAFTKLRDCVRRIYELLAERSFHEARKQAATREIRTLMELARREATAVRAGLKHGLGEANEGLVRYGVKPFRGRKRAKKASPAPEANGSPPSEEPST